MITLNCEQGHVQCNLNCQQAQFMADHLGMQEAVLPQEASWQRGQPSALRLAHRLLLLEAGQIAGCAF